MMDAVVVYGSLHGTAKQYAEELASRLTIAAKSYEQVGSLDGAQVVVYVGSLYAGGVLGMKKTLARLSDDSSRNVVVVTVGLADPEDEQNRNSIRESIRGQLPSGLYERVQMFHVRGGIDYGNLSLKHRTMMGLLYRKAKNLPPDEQTADSRAMVETYGQKVNFVDLETLDPVVRFVKSMLDA